MRKKIALAWLAMITATVTHAKTLFEITPDSPHQPYPARGSYVVLITESDHADAGWRKAAEILCQKYDGKLVQLPDNSLDAALTDLKRIRPRYVCLVSSPERCGRNRAVQMHRMMRRIDEDPYTDAIWGILTGYDPADAVRITERSEPLIINSAASSMGPGIFKNLDSGFASAETRPTNFWTKVKGGDTVFKPVSPDPAKALADAFNNMPPDLFVTSGHATEHDWQIGYGVRAGQFRHKDGQLYSLSTTGERYDINSAHPKIYMPMGNCLIGHVSGKDCMATSWMHTGGVHQMFGYTAVTFYGYMGWGIGTYFGGGRLTLAQSWFLNNQALVHEIETKYPDKARINFLTYGHGDAGKLARRHGLDRNSLGALWDRDVVPLYGDPAWEARHRPSAGWVCKLERKRHGKHVLTIETVKDGAWGNRPVGVLFPERMSDVEHVECETVEGVLVADDFALIPLKGKFAKGDTHVVTFTAE